MHKIVLKVLTVDKIYDIFIVSNETVVRFNADINFVGWNICVKYTDIAEYQL